MDPFACLLLAILSSSTGAGLGVYVRGIVGDPLSLISSDQCPAGRAAKLLRVLESGGAQMVCARERGDWTPAEAYKDRVRTDSTLGFNRTFYTDEGVYELSCGAEVTIIHVGVAAGYEVSVQEGGRGTLPCYTRKPGSSVRWQRDQQLVLEVDSSGGTKPGPGFEGRVSLPPDASEHGDFTLTLDPVQLGDEGRYFCSVRDGEAGDPAAVRVKVTRTDPDQTTLNPPHNTRCPSEEKMGTGATVAITAAVTGAVFTAAGCFLKFYHCRTEGGRSP